VRLTNRSPHLSLSAAAVALLAISPLVASARPAPSFTVKTLEGKPLKSSDLKQKPMIVDFWATWCGPCRASMPHLSAMQTRYEKQGLTVIGLSVDEQGPQGVKKFANQLGVKFTLAMANDDVLDAYGPIRSIPTTFFINRKGDIVRRVVGYIDGETMEDYVKEILE
jgi:thiol-disulfide isomerase/thioredoxin